MTNYTQWKSLVDLQEYSAIPDTLDDHWLIDSGSGTTLSNGISDRDIDLPNGVSWQDISDFNGWAIRLDGNDQYGVSQDQFYIGQEKVTAMAWFNPISWQDFATPLSAQNDPESVPNDGWNITAEDDGETLSLEYHDSGSTDRGWAQVTIPDVDSIYFVAAVLDGDFGELQLFDETGHIETASGSSSRGLTDQNLFFGARDGRYPNWDWFEILTANTFDTDLPEDVWNATKP